MPITPAIVKPLNDLYNDLVNGAEDLVGAVSQMAPAAAREILCSAGGLASLGGGPLGPYQSPGSGNRMASDLGGILEAACPVPPPLPPIPQPEPEKGQCEGILYDVQYTLVRRDRLTCADLSDVQGGAVLLGPIKNFRLTTPDVAFCEFGGEPFIRFEADTGTPSTPTIIQSASGNFRWRSFTIDSITRQDGQPDDCGEILPPAPVPRTPIVQPPPSPPIPWVGPPGSPGGDYIFEPVVGPIFVGPDGGINIPVVININDPMVNIPISIPVNVSLPDFKPTFNFGGSGGGPGGGTEPGPPEGICCEPPPPKIRPAPVEDPDEPPEDPPDESSRIVAVLVKSEETGEPVRASRLFTAKPALLVPRIATVQFELEFDTELYLSRETQVKQEMQYVEAPETGIVTRAFVEWEPGWDGSFEYVSEPVNESTV